MKNIHIICIGNLWQGDDGVGIHLCQRLAQKKLPDFVKVFDGGIAGLGVFNYFEGCQKVILVDALQFQGEEGGLHRVEMKSIFSQSQGLFHQAEQNPNWSSHRLDVHSLFQILPILFEKEQFPELVLLGIEIKKIQNFTDRLSPLVEASMERLMDLVEKEFQIL